MKKLSILLLLAIMGASVGYLVFRNRTIKSDPNELRATDLTIRSIEKGNEVDYDVRLHIRFTKAGNRPVDVVDFQGVLTSFQRSENEFVTEWKTISQYSIDGSPVEPTIVQSLVGKQGISEIIDNKAKHYLGSDFPKSFLRTQLMILDRLFVTVPVHSEQNLSQDELDDLVPFRAEYSFAKENEFRIVRKKWASYQNVNSSVDPSLDMITYYYDASGQLLAAQGQVRSVFKDQGSSELLIDFWAKSVETRIASERFQTITRDAFALVDMDRVKANDIQSRAASGLSFEEAMARIDGITENTESGAYYETFRAVTDQVRANPEYSEVIAKRILELKERDPHTRRKLSALFGALAESQHSEGIDTLDRLARECPDNYCQVQAVMGVNTHLKPSNANLQSMLDLGRSASDKEVAATALIAAGAVGRKLEGDQPDLSKELIRTFNDQSKADIKTSTLAAMGNHGSSEYWPTLSNSLKSEDSNERAAAAYSLRYIPNEDVNATLLNVIEKEPISRVVSEAMKASAYRKLSAEQYKQLANSAVSFKNEELAEQAAALLVGAHKSNPSAVQDALNTLREKSKYADVRTYINDQLNPKPTVPLP